MKDIFLIKILSNEEYYYIFDRWFQRLLFLRNWCINELKDWDWNVLELKLWWIGFSIHRKLLESTWFTGILLIFEEDLWEIEWYMNKLIWNIDRNWQNREIFEYHIENWELINW